MRKHFATAVIAASALARRPITALRRPRPEAPTPNQRAPRPIGRTPIGRRNRHRFLLQPTPITAAARPTAARFDQGLLTAAHAWLPFGTKVKVTLDGTNQSVDRHHNRPDLFHRRIVDLSAAAARATRHDAGRTRPGQPDPGLNSAGSA